jgi:hypothetical protein
MGEYKSPSEKQSAKATPAKKLQDSSNVGEAEFSDSRSSTFHLKKFQEVAQDNSRGSGLSQLQNKSSNHTGTSRIAQLQRMSDERNSEQSAFIQKNENKTGIPDGLKSGMESVSGISLNDVTVHRNSNKPAQLQAHAFAQGTDIHLGPGQEKHLPHEAWHVVQQKQGRVQATTQGNGNVPINDNPSLEREATQMGQKALKESNSGIPKLKNATVSSNATAQLMTNEEFFAAISDTGKGAFNAADAFGAFDDVKNGAAAVKDYAANQAMGLGHHLTTDSKDFKGTGVAGRYHQLDGKDAHDISSEKRKEQLDDKEAMKTNPGWHLARKAGEKANDMIGESAGAAVDAFGFGIPGLGSVASEVAKAPGNFAVNKLKEKSMVGTNRYEQLLDDDDMAHKNENVGKEGFLEGMWRTFKGR